MSIFLSLSERFTDALETFDPFRGEWFSRIVDPRPGTRAGSKPSWGRLGTVALLLIGPVWLFSAIPSSLTGGSLVGPGGLVSDVGFYSITFWVVATLALLAIARRILGDLMNELIRRETVDISLRTFRPSSARVSKALRFLEWLSRPAGLRGLIWYFLLLADQLAIYYVYLTDGRATWYTSAAAPGTCFYAWRFGKEQPNLAGLWCIFVIGPIGLYLVVLVARLFVVFACLCSEVARNRHLRICPSHPDKTGGLLPIGQVALLLSLFTFILGFDLAGLTANEYALNAVFRPAASYGQTNLKILSALWAAYAVLGPLLFFLPLFPLRRRMAAAKRSYLLEANDLHVSAARKHQEDVRCDAFRPTALQGLVALDALMDAGAQMSIWPFDQRTFVRYAGLLVAPLVPMILQQMPRALRFLKAVLWLR